MHCVPRDRYHCRLFFSLAYLIYDSLCWKPVLNISLAQILLVLLIFVWIFYSKSKLHLLSVHHIRKNKCIMISTFSRKERPMKLTYASWEVHLISTTPDRSSLNINKINQSERRMTFDLNLVDDKIFLLKNFIKSYFSCSLFNLSAVPSKNEKKIKTIQLLFFYTSFIF